MNKAILNTIVAAMAVMTMTGSASAGDGSSSKIKGLYLGTGISALKATGNDSAALRGTLPEIHIGYAANNNVSFEYRRYLNDINSNDNYIAGQARVSGINKINNIQSFLIKTKADYGQFNIGVIGGYSLAKFYGDHTNVAIAPAVFPTSRVIDSVNLKGFTYGVSTGYSFNNNVSLNAEYMHILKNKGMKLTGFGTNIEYKF